MRMNGFYVANYDEKLIVLIERLKDKIKTIEDIKYSLKEFGTAQDVARFIRACAVVTKEKVSEVFLNARLNYEEEKDEITKRLLTFEYLGFSSNDIATHLSAIKEVIVKCKISDIGEEFSFKEYIKYTIFFTKDNEQDFLLYKDEEFLNERTLSYLEQAIRDSD